MSGMNKAHRNSSPMRFRYAAFDKVLVLGTLVMPDETSPVVEFKPEVPPIVLDTAPGVPDIAALAASDVVALGITALLALEALFAPLRHPAKENTIQDIMSKIISFFRFIPPICLTGINISRYILIHPNFQHGAKTNIFRGCIVWYNIRILSFEVVL
ncbi:MAG TPA: hypothetical protein VHO71_00555 [Caproiciproducens sp.]|nr:hypothetical protein [Caproiciproducens sp.]